MAAAITVPTAEVVSAVAITEPIMVPSATTPRATEAIVVPVGAIPPVMVEAIQVSTAPSPAIPGAGADEYTAVKPLRTVVAVRSTGVRIPGVVAPITYRGTVITAVVIVSGRHHGGAYPDANPPGNLGVCGGGGKGQEQKKGEQ
jgi:hypothetical protein